EDDLLGPVVLAGMHLLQIGQPPQWTHRRLIDSAFGLVDPPIFRRSASGRLRPGGSRTGKGHRQDDACMTDRVAHGFHPAKKPARAAHDCYAIALPASTIPAHEQL